MVELDASRLLIDERLGRSVAASYGLKLRGIVGILINAKQQGLIRVLKPILDRLIDEAGFPVSQALYDRALLTQLELLQGSLNEQEWTLLSTYLETQDYIEMTVHSWQAAASETHNV